MILSSRLPMHRPSRRSLLRFLFVLSHFSAAAAFVQIMPSFTTTASAHQQQQPTTSPEAVETTAHSSSSSSSSWQQRRRRQGRRVCYAVNGEQQQDAVSTATAAGSIFEVYDKPIVLVGCSSDASELYALAHSFLRQHFSATTNDDAADADDSHHPRVIQVASSTSTDANDPAEGSLPSLIDRDDLIRSIVDERKYRWPSIVVVDLGDAVFRAVDAAGGDNSNKEGEERLASLESHYKDIAKALYDNKLLSVYVNVDPVESRMDEATAERKGRLDDFFVRNSDYELCVHDESVAPEDNADEWAHLEWELARLVARSRLGPAVPGDDGSSSRSTGGNAAHLTMGDNTFFLSLSFPDIAEVEPYAEEMCQDVDAMEYRTDLLDCRDSRFDLLYGMQLLRWYCRPYAVRVPALPFAGTGTLLEDVVPIVYTVRTQNQAGTYPDDDEGIRKMFEMLEWGLRGGVEILDVESAWDPGMTDDLLELARERYSSQILGSHHVVGKEITTEEAVELFEQCALDGRAHGAKVVLSIESEEKDKMAYEAALIASELAASEGKPVIPNISLILGDVGQFSRVINLPFTPVTHESLPVKAAPGQLTANEVMATRLLTQIFSPRRFAILGHNIAYSVSPQMHNAAFAATKLANEYLRADVATVEEFVESDFFKSDVFGGCSVTIPHKQAIIPYVDVLSEAAKDIGSVNTLIVKEEFVDDDFKRVIYGDNTDWRGIYNPLSRLLASSVNPDADYALILGAGGTARAAAYVAAKLGLKRIYYNRTPSKANELVDAFGGIVVTSLAETNESENEVSLGSVIEPGSRIRVAISTLPAAAKFLLPEWLFHCSRKDLPIVFDVNYKPYNTELLLQAEKLGCRVVRGSEMLWEQGIGQFELWTGRTAPYRVMKNVVLENCIESESTAEATTTKEK